MGRPLDPPARPRNRTLDIVRGLGILLVVLGHNLWVAEGHGPLFRWIFSFHVPLFFFLSGVLFRPTQSVGTLVLQRADSLLKPYLVLLLALGVIRMANGSASPPVYLVGVLYGTGGTIALAPLWFLPHLFAVTLVCWLVLRALETLPCPRYLLPGLLVAMLVGGYRILPCFWNQPLTRFGGPERLLGREVILPGLPFSLDLVPITAAFFLAGSLLRESVLGFAPRLLPALFSTGLLVGLQWTLGLTMDLNLRRYDSLLICTVQAIAGVYLTFTLAWLIDRGNWLASALAGIGSASLVVLLFHEAIQNETYVRLRALLPVWPWIPALLAFCLAVGVSLLLWHQARRQQWLGRLLLPWQASSPPVHKLPS